MFFSLLTAMIALAGAPHQAIASPRASAAAPKQIRESVEKSLVFLRTDAVQWREKSKCATCHEGAMTVTVFCEARSRGFAVPEQSLTEMLDWTKGRFVPEYETKPHLTDGFQIPSLAMPLLTLSLVTKPDVLTPDEMDRIGKYITDRQEADGGWPLQEHNPHPVMESRETMTLWFYLALEVSAQSDRAQHDASRLSREKAMAWLTKTPPADTTQVSALRLLVNLRAGQPRKKLQRQMDELLHRQNADGGWGQTRSLPSDAYATGQALFVLGLAGLKGDRKEMQRGASFLLATQRADGSWPMIPRETPERKPSTNLVPIHYFGAAWATLGLVRSLPAEASDRK